MTRALKRPIVSAPQQRLTSSSHPRRRKAANGQRKRADQRRAAVARATTDLEPLDYQQVHSPTEPVEIVLRHTTVADGRGGVARVDVTREQGVRRIVDARLWDRMTPAEQRAAERIYAAFAILARGLGYQTSLLGRERIDGSRADPDVQQDLLDDYFRWGRRCQEQKLEHSAIMDVLGYGRSCAETDRLRRKRKGFTSLTLGEGLDLYCHLKGWPRRRGSW